MCALSLCLSSAVYLFVFISPVWMRMCARVCLQASPQGPESPAQAHLPPIKSLAPRREPWPLPARQILLSACVMFLNPELWSETFVTPEIFSNLFFAHISTSLLPSRPQGDSKPGSHSSLFSQKHLSLSPPELCSKSHIPLLHLLCGALISTWVVWCDVSHLLKVTAVFLFKTTSGLIKMCRCS